MKLIEIFTLRMDLGKIPTSTTGKFHTKIAKKNFFSLNQLISPMSSSSDITAHCICEDHSFCVDANAIKFGFASCHCSKCRLSHSAPFVMWSGVKADCADRFHITSKPDASLSSFRTSGNCMRYFCSRCGTHLYIQYDLGKEEASPWSGEIHFPTALLDEENVVKLEKVLTDVYIVIITVFNQMIVLGHQRNEKASLFARFCVR